ncbi:hypothetical protein RB195_021994 [Necator americanus]|uniref:Cytochrome P450 n=1 Tax=Necator americanus TaxID=51031 RepID=A0ABR1EDU3_NECAM
MWSRLGQFDDVVLDLLGLLHQIFDGRFRCKRTFVQLIDEHEEALLLDGEPRDFMEAYLREVRRNPEHDHIRRRSLCFVAADLWTGGMETTVTTMRWAIIYLVYHPSVLIRCQMELDKVLLYQKTSQPISTVVLRKIVCNSQELQDRQKAKSDSNETAQQQSKALPPIPFPRSFIRQQKPNAATNVSNDSATQAVFELLTEQVINQLVWLFRGAVFLGNALPDGFAIGQRLAPTLAIAFTATIEEHDLCFIADISTTASLSVRPKQRLTTVSMY